MLTLFVKPTTDMQSGICRSMNGTVNCEPNFLHAFDIYATIFDDIMASNTSNASSTSAEQYQQFTSTTSINNTLVYRLSTAVGALLILSVILGFFFIPLSLLLNSAFSKILLIFLVFDACELFSALCMFYSIFRNEVAGAYAAAPGIDPKYWPVSFGLGVWLLASAFVCRLLSNPILFIVLVTILLAAVLFPILFLLLCFCGMSPDVILIPVSPFYN
jgi:hypothetical protein